jgi:hypothetical protein
MLALCALYMFSFIPAVIVQCIPIRISWQHWDGEHHGRCINLNIEGWVSGIANIVFDVIIICLPLPSLVKLNMRLRKKLGVLLMVLGGSL